MGSKINSPVSRIIMDNNKNMWIATVGQGIFHYNSHTDELYQYTALGKINSDYISDIIEDSSGVIWVASMNDGISKFIPSEDLFQKVAAGGIKNTISILRMQDITFGWVVVETGFIGWKKGNKLVQKLEPSDSTRVFQVRSIVERIPGELLIASDEGLTKYNTQTGEKHIIHSDQNQPNGLNDNYLQTLFVDREQSTLGRYLLRWCELHSANRRQLYTLLQRQHPVGWQNNQRFC